MEEETPQIICYIKEKQREYKQGSDAYNVLRSLEVTLPNMLIDFANESKWVSMEDRPPEDYGVFSVVLQGRVISASWNGQFYNVTAGGTHYYEQITHWQPLPKPPNTN